MNINLSENEADYGETVYKKAARWITLSGVALVPLFFLPLTTGVLELNKQMLMTVAAGSGLILWLLDVVMSGKLTWRFNPLDKGVVALAGAAALSSLFSIDWFKSVFGLAGSLSDSLLTVVSLTVLYLLIINLFDDNGKTLKSIFSVSLAVAILYGLIQMFGIYILGIFKYFDISGFDLTSSRAFNTLGSVNALGMVSAIALPLLYRTKFEGSIFKYLNIGKLGAFAALAVLAVINWWVLWAVAIAGMISMIALDSVTAVRNEENSKVSKFKISRFLFPMTVIVFGIFLVVVNLNLVFVRNNLPVEIMPSQGLSLNVALKTLKDNFVFGWGPENFSLAFDMYGAGELRNSTLSGAKFFDSVSYVLNMAVHNGLAGLTAFGFLLFLILRHLFQVIRFEPDSLNSENVGVISAAVAAAVALFFHPFNTVLIMTFYVLLALLALALWGKYRAVHNVEEKASLSLISSLGFIGGLILVLVGFYFVSLNYIADVKYAKALGETDTESALNHVVEAINLNGNDDRFYRLSSQLALALLSKELNAKSNGQENNKIQNYLSSSVSLAQKAAQIAPNENSNWVNLGNIYQNLMRLVDGADALAEGAYLKASELRPGDPAFHNRIGSMYLLKADLLRQLSARAGGNAQQYNQQANAALLKAEDAFKKAIEMSDKFGLAIYNLGSVYERQGKINEAIKQLETVAPFNDNQPGLAFELGLLYYRANRKNDAFVQLQRAVVLSPDYANARWYLALLHEERQQISQAIEQLERILSIEVNKDNEAVIKKLEELKAGAASIPAGDILDQKPL
ncbi:MAG: tetratricopeptide repeat protein [Patescibacteria group bacterium]